MTRPTTASLTASTVSANVSNRILALACDAVQDFLVTGNAGTDAQHEPPVAEVLQCRRYAGQRGTTCG